MAAYSSDDNESTELVVSFLSGFTLIFCTASSGFNFINIFDLMSNWTFGHRP